MSDREVTNGGDKSERVTVRKTDDESAPRNVRRFRLAITAGATPRAWSSTADVCSIGSHQSNDLVIDEETVSRFHADIRLTTDGVVVSDLGSLNGTLVDGVAIREVYLRHGSAIKLGEVVLRFELERATNRIAQSTHFGGLESQDPRMRETIALLARAATTDATVLIEGETGTGKGVAAAAIHAASPRCNGPFAVVDCGALSPTLLESELFGHEKGAFTGADSSRVGACEEASGGTLFLDEIGELPLELQPKLLRLLDDRTTRRVGSNTHRPVDIRIVAATNRDLRREVNDGRFRSDLYYRLAVARLALPPLRERRGDIPLLLAAIAKQLGAPPAVTTALQRPDSLARLQRSRWPGNIRELRAHVERVLIFGDAEPDDAAADPAVRPPFLEARRRAQHEFERTYLSDLIDAFGTQTVKAAAAAGLDRVYLYRLLKRHGLR